MNLKDELTDKMRKLNRMDTLWLEITEACNMKCVHCYVGDRKEHGFRHIRLNLEIIMDIVKEAKELGAFNVIITGGEPFLYPHLFELCRRIKELNFMLGIYTNGTLIDEETAKFLKEINVHIMTITNYGTDKKHYEQTTRVPGSYEQYNRGIKNLEKWDVPYKLQTVLLSTNEENRDALYELCSRRFEMRIYTGRDGSDHPEDYRPSDQAVRDIFRKIYDEYQEEGREVPEFNFKDDDYICALGRGRLVLDINGNLKVCNNSKIVGSVHENTLEEVWNNEQVKKIREVGMWKNFKKCIDCTYSKYMYNLCPVMNYLETEDMNEPPEEQCRLCRLRYEVITRAKEENNEDIQGSRESTA